MCPTVMIFGVIKIKRKTLIMLRVYIESKIYYSKAKFIDVSYENLDVVRKNLVVLFM